VCREEPAEPADSRTKVKGSAEESSVRWDSATIESRARTSKSAGEETEGQKKSSHKSRIRTIFPQFFKLRKD